MTSRIQSASQALSARTVAPLGRSLRSSSAMGASFACPDESSNCTGKPLPMTEHAAWWSTLHDFDRDKHLHSFFERGSLLMDADTRRIDHLYPAVMGCAHRIHRAVPASRLSPAVGAIVDGRVRAISLRKVGRCARSGKSRSSPADCQPASPHAVCSTVGAE